jgi:hypothetical protein
MKMNNIRGHVIIKKKDGTVILDKDNMIVLEGRKYIKELFIKSFSNTILPTNSPSNLEEETARGEYDLEFKGYSISHMKIGDGGEATLLSSQDLTGGTTRFVPITNSSIKFSNVSSDMFIIIEAKIDNISQAQPFTVQELGLFLTVNANTEDEENDPIMFSRIVFDPIPVASGDEYEVSYYVYF